jgi:predicted negative regulator of RcsB-dependent stress response
VKSKIVDEKHFDGVFEGLALTMKASPKDHGRSISKGMTQMANDTTNTTGMTKTPRPGGRVPPKEHLVEIKDADVVQEQIVGGIHWIEDNARVVIALIVVAILIGFAFAAWQMVTTHQEKVAQENYYKVEAPFMKARDAFEKSKFKAFIPPDQADKTVAVAPSGDIAKDYGPLLTGLENTAHEYAGTAAGGQAAILVAQTYLEYKNPDKAAEYAQIPALKLPKDHTIALLGRILWGNALADKGDCQAALSTWQPVLDMPSAAYLASDVNLRSGACLEKLGQNDRAAEAYRKASVGGDSPSAQSAKGLLRALELKNPSLASGPVLNTAPKAQ